MVQRNVFHDTGVSPSAKVTKSPGKSGTNRRVSGATHPAFATSRSTGSNHCFGRMRVTTGRPSVLAMPKPRHELIITPTHSSAAPFHNPNAAPFAAAMTSAGNGTNVCAMLMSTEASGAAAPQRVMEVRMPSRNRPARALARDAVMVNRCRVVGSIHTATSTAATRAQKIVWIT